jgi:hypothetical protein
MSEQSIRDAWFWQAAVCENMGAPFTAAVLRCMVEDEGAKAALAPILAPYDDPSARALLTAAMPLRLLGGLHCLVLSGAAPALAASYASGGTDGLGPLVAEAAEAHADVLARFMTSPPQTNEVRRALALVGGFLTVAKETSLPLRCLELGASAGLNMNWDRYAYAFGATDSADVRRWGDADAVLTLDGEWTGGTPPLDAKVTVAEKRACDLAPIDVRSEAGALRLQSYIWPEQSDRLDRVRAAIGLARRTDIAVETADAADWAKANVTPKSGLATVVYHSSFLQYPPPEVQAAIVGAIEAAGEGATTAAPLAWLRKEPSGEAFTHDEVRLTLWPGGEDRLLATAHPHGAQVNWLA